MSLTLAILAVATFISTYLGGLFALRFKDKSHLIVGFSAGAVVGLAFFDLLPESISMSAKKGDFSTVILVTAIGFLIYMVIDRIFGVHSHGALHDEHHHEEIEEKSHRGSIRAGSLSIHSLLDGLGIGFAFQVSPALGLVVAVAVLGHDFCDGINTVTAIIKGGSDRLKALRWLFLDAIAPVLGIILTLFITLSEDRLRFILALFAGFFLYIGASDLVPESYHAHPTWKTTLATVLGALFLFAIITIAG
jgi:ZIP family zinc transporter